MFRLNILAFLLFWIFSCYQAQPAVSNKQKLVIDHDGGADDAHAIIISLLYEAYFDGPEVVALTTTHGNVNQSQVVINSARILDLCDRNDVLIYAGAKNTLIHGIVSDYFFGADGLGDTGYVHPHPVKVESEHAAVGLVELSKKYEGELIIMAIGPMTNIALAARLDPDFISRLAHLYVGAGDVYDELNLKAPEFNVDIDPEAYYIVADTAKLGKVTFVPFSQIKASLYITKEWRTNVLGTIQTPIMTALNSFEGVSFPQTQAWTLLDPAVASITLNSNIVTEFKNTSNGVILCGDKRAITTNDFTSTTPNGRSVYSADVDKYKKFLIDIYSAELTKAP